MMIDKRDQRYYAIGIAGVFLILYSTLQVNPHSFGILGSSLLLITAMYFRYTYFIALELIIISGHGAMIFGFGPTLQIIIPILLCTQLLAFYVLSGQYKNGYLFIGIIGIAILCIAFMTNIQWYFLFGSLFVSIYAIQQVVEGYRAALIWAALNVFFLCISIGKILSVSF